MITRCRCWDSSVYSFLRRPRGVAFIALCDTGVGNRLSEEVVDSVRTRRAVAQAQDSAGSVTGALSEGPEYTKHVGASGSAVWKSRTAGADTTMPAHIVCRATCDAYGTGGGHCAQLGKDNTHQVHIQLHRPVAICIQRPFERQGRQGHEERSAVGQRTRGYSQENNGRRRARAVVRYRRRHSLV